MFVDNSGAFWLSDPVLVLALIAGAVALMVWCHRWSETGTMPLPRGMMVRRLGASQATRSPRQRLDARPSALSERRSLRTRRVGSHPQQAA
jgi:hypothetical protein